MSRPLWMKAARGPGRVGLRMRAGGRTCERRRTNRRRGLPFLGCGSFAVERVGFSVLVCVCV